MGYMLPLKFIKVSQKLNDNGQFDVAICATRIVAIMSTETLQGRRTIKEEKRAGTLINAAGRQAARSVIFLDNGSVVASPLSVQRIMTAIEKANYKDSKGTNPVRLKVYDVVDDEPIEGMDEEDEISVIDIDKEDDSDEDFEEIDEPEFTDGEETL